MQSPLPPFAFDVPAAWRGPQLDERDWIWLAGADLAAELEDAARAAQAAGNRAAAQTGSRSSAPSPSATSPIPGRYRPDSSLSTNPRRLSAASNRCALDLGKPSDRPIDVTPCAALSLCR